MGSRLLISLLAAVILQRQIMVHRWAINNHKVQEHWVSLQPCLLAKYTEGMSKEGYLERNKRQNFSQIHFFSWNLVIFWSRFWIHFCEISLICESSLPTIHRKFVVMSFWYLLKIPVNEEWALGLSFVLPHFPFWTFW